MEDQKDTSMEDQEVTRPEYQEVTSPTKDRFFTTYILFNALGSVTVIPFSFFTTATDYWMYKFRDPESNESYNTKNRTDLQAEFVADFSIVSNIGNSVFLILTILWISKLSILVRTILTLSGITGLFAFTCVLVKVNTDSWQSSFLVTTLLTGFCLSGCTAVFLMTIVEMAPKFPPSYVAGIFSGQAVCGIFAALVQIAALSIGAGPVVNGLVYFLSGTLFVFLTLLGFLISLKRSHFFKQHFWVDLKVDKLVVSKQKFFSAFRKIKFYMLALVIVTGTTISIQPGVTALVLSVDKGNGNKWNDVYFVPVITFLVYYCSDYCGRELAVVLKKPNHAVTLLSGLCLRVVLVPMVMLCNAQPRRHLPVIFTEDYAYIIFIMVFASTNGFLGNRCIICVSQIPTNEERPLTLFSMMLLTIASLMAFSYVSKWLVKAL